MCNGVDDGYTWADAPGKICFECESPLGACYFVIYKSEKVHRVCPYCYNELRGEKHDY